jgi:DNA repair protein RadA
VAKESEEEKPKEKEKEKEKKKKPTTVAELPGVGESTADKLESAGFASLERIAVCSPVDLAVAAGIGEGTAAKIINAARDALEIGYETADKTLERRKSVGRVTTGSKEFDALIGGGVETGSITEVFSRFSSGKTQIAFQLCVNVQLPKEQGGLEGNVMFVDTEGTFRPDRIVQLAQAKGLNPEKILKGIYVVRAYTSDHQMILIDKSEEIIREHNIKIIIVDSLTSLFRADYTGRGTLAERQQKLNKHVHALQRLADVYGLAVYVTNQVMDRPDMLFGDPTAPVGGNILAHASTYRLYLRRSKEDRRIVKLVDSPHLPEGEALFRVTPQGIADAEE